jgi:hypothetical protein
MSHPNLRALSEVAACFGVFETYVYVVSVRSAWVATSQTISTHAHVGFPSSRLGPNIIAFDAITTSEQGQRRLQIHAAAEYRTDPNDLISSGYRSAA